MYSPALGSRNHGCGGQVSASHGEEHLQCFGQGGKDDAKEDQAQNNDEHAH